MKWNLAGYVGVAVCALVVAAPVFAHHGGSDVYDYSVRIEGKATVTEMVWKNPHAQIFFKMKDNAGKEITWGVELNSPGNLVRTGWTPKTFQAGDEINVVFIPSKGEAPYGACGDFTRADGRTFKNGQFCGTDMTKLPVRADYAASK